MTFDRKYFMEQEHEGDLIHRSTVYPDKEIPNCYYIKYNKTLTTNAQMSTYKKFSFDTH